MSQGTRPRRDDLGRSHSSMTMLFTRSQPNLFNLKCHKRRVKIEKFKIDASYQMAMELEQV